MKFIHTGDLHIGKVLHECDLLQDQRYILGQIAGLAARGCTEIEEIQYIERGYEDIVEKLQSLGADIRQVTIPDTVLRQAL